MMMMITPQSLFSTERMLCLSPLQQTVFPPHKAEQAKVAKDVPQGCFCLCESLIRENAFIDTGVESSLYVN